MVLGRPGEARGEGAPAGHNVANGTINGMSYLGDCTLYEVKLESGRMVRVSRANLSRFDQDEFTWDEKVSLHWHPSSPIVLLA
jgi:spermidine/putrescine transport system ATP-binding protein/putrescine transport system ATP-binding protein